MPPQWAFFQSTAKIRGYGGAMGGGKTRALCELAWDLALVHPGIRIPVSRKSHVDVVSSTRKLFFEQVCVDDAVEGKKESQGEDWIRLYNGSEIHFTGLDNPVKRFSTESGFWIFDEAHEIPESTIVLCNTRLRQRCIACIKDGIAACAHYPHGMAMGFNPENPDHWLHRWFYEAGELLKWEDGTLKGYKKDKLWPKDSVVSIGDAEFIFARAQDNPYLAPDYVEENLGGLPEFLRKRYLEGEWIYVSGEGFFDAKAMMDLTTSFPSFVASAQEIDKKAKLVPDNKGPWWVWAPPVREKKKIDERGFETIEDAHRYLVAVDVSSGTANDFSAIQVIDANTLEQVAEFQAKIAPTDLAVQAVLIARIYNMAMIIPEITGGWGVTIVYELKRLKYGRMYTRRVIDRITNKFTDALGWDTNIKTRAVMLDSLARLVSEGNSGVVSPRLKAEMNTFVWPEVGRGTYAGVPQAQPGANDDLVMSYAIGIAVALSLPRELRKPYHPRVTIAGAR